MQKDLKDLKKAKIQVVAISYDAVEKLASFAKQKKISFPLLSDADSKVIDAYGIRNEEARGTRMDGVPHPGTFIIDQDGVIRAKLFYRHYVKRHSSQDLINAASEPGKRPDK